MDPAILASQRCQHRGLQHLSQNKLGVCHQYRMFVLHGFNNTHLSLSEVSPATSQIFRGDTDVILHLGMSNFPRSQDQNRSYPISSRLHETDWTRPKIPVVFSNAACSLYTLQLQPQFQ